jgi:D-alanyl-D-alanine carboxypeptidase/D-alanyl-D-alanine-endopeptidase (penicillin-binding protein 4)
MLRRLIFSALVACGSAQAALPEPVLRQLQAANIPEDAVGAVVLRSTQVLLSHQAGQSMQPASTMKLVTTLVGLDTLGPVFKGRTELRSNGVIENGVLQGDLYMRGGADADFNEDALVHMLEKLRTAGIRKIAGNLVLDRTLFQPARPDVDASPFDESPHAYYNLIPDALLLNMNLLRVTLDSSGGKLRLDMLPQLEKVAITSDMRLVDGDCAKWDDGWQEPTWARQGTRITVTLHGTFPRHCGPKATTLNLLDRNDYAERLFRSTWTRLGGTFGGVAREATPETATPASARLLADHVSRPLAEVLRDINKNSDNGLARTLYLSLGSLEADPVLGSRPLALPANPMPVIGGGPSTAAARANGAAGVAAGGVGPATSAATVGATAPIRAAITENAPAAASMATPASAAGAAHPGNAARLAGMPDGLTAANGSAPIPGSPLPAESTAARAEQTVRAWLRRHGIDDTGLVLDNGSGLSRSERIKPAQMAALLQAAQHTLWMPEFLTSLPIAAIDGTMKRRLKDSPAAMRARVKTGTLKNAIAIAGYVPDANGEQCIVVAFINHDLVGNGNGRKVAMH